MKRGSPIALCLILVSLITSACSTTGLETTGGSSEHIDTESTLVSSGFNMGAWLSGLYRKHISPVDGSRCPSSPSCSSYSAQAFQKHGFFMGWVMTVDRLIHEGGEEVPFTFPVYSGGDWKIHDPVENNDCWWYHGNGKDCE